MSSNNNIDHKDFFGNTLEIGNVVVISDGNRGKLHLAKITRFTKKMVDVEIISKTGSWRKKMLRYPYDVLLANEELAVEYILTKT